jgi:hypothetical protein
MRQRRVLNDSLNVRLAAMDSPAALKMRLDLSQGGEEAPFQGIEFQFARIKFHVGTRWEIMMLKRGRSVNSSNSGMVRPRISAT